MLDEYPRSLFVVHPVCVFGALIATFLRMVFLIRDLDIDTREEDEQGVLLFFNMPLEDSLSDGSRRDEE
jgi:hypothetical protein